MAKNPKPVAKKPAPSASPKKIPAAEKRQAAKATAPVKASPAKKLAKVAKEPAPAKPGPASRPAAGGKGASSSPSMEKPSKKSALRDSILKRKTAAKPIAFSLDEVRAIAQTVTTKTAAPQNAKSVKGANAKSTSAVVEKSKPQHVKAASLADILGFNPKKKRRRQTFRTRTCRRNSSGITRF
jgi:hypothetical protein